MTLNWKFAKNVGILQYYMETGEGQGLKWGRQSRRRNMTIRMLLPFQSIVR